MTKIDEALRLESFQKRKAAKALETELRSPELHGDLATRIAVLS